MRVFIVAVGGSYYQSDEELQAAEDHYEKEMDEDIKQQQAEERAAREGEIMQDWMDERYDSCEEQDNC